MIALRTSKAPVLKLREFTDSDVRQLGPLDLSRGFNSWLVIHIDKKLGVPEAPMLLIGTGLQFIDVINYLAQFLPNEQSDSLDMDIMFLYRNDKLIATLRATPAGPEVELATS